MFVLALKGAGYKDYIYCAKDILWDNLYEITFSCWIWMCEESIHVCINDMCMYTRNNYNVFNIFVKILSNMKSEIFSALSKV